MLNKSSCSTARTDDGFEIQFQVNESKMTKFILSTMLINLPGEPPQPLSPHSGAAARYPGLSGIHWRCQDCVRDF